MGLFGIGLGILALRGGARKPARANRRDLEQLFAEIGRGLRALSASGRVGGLGFLLEKHSHVERQLTEMQSRLRQLDDSMRERYEKRAQRVLELAARCGITLPPP
jgi:hypothetical protein